MESTRLLLVSAPDSKKSSMVYPDVVTAVPGFDTEDKTLAKKKAAKGVPPEQLALYEKLVATKPSVERKGATNPYTSLNGNMFTYLSPDGVLGIRLPENEREEFLKKYKTSLYKSHGTILKEYVTIPDALFKKTNDLAKYFNLSYEYAKTLKPKPTKKKSS